MKINKILVLILLLLFTPRVLFAFDADLEKGLQQDLFESLTLIEKALEKMQEGNPAANEISRLKSGTESIKASHMLLRERFRTRADIAATMGSKASERQSAMSNSYFQAIGEYLSMVEDIQPQEGVSQTTLDELKTLLKKILYRKKPLIFGTLPYKALNYPAQQPIEAPAITPAYKGGNKTVSPDDLNSTPEAPVSEEIVAMAESLEWNPVLIYEWVKNNVETQWYWGCMKGAEETLRQKSGNDSDQAALLVALFRACGFPSRYVRGVIAFFPGIETVRNLIGLENPEAIAEFFQKAGIPHKLVIEGGKITNFQIEHIWVESRIPFANFHGAMVDEHGKAWLGLDTSIKVAGYTYSDPVDILDQYPIADMRDEYLSTFREQTPLEHIRSGIETFLAQNFPGTTYEELLGTKVLTPETMNILPASLQFKQVLITNEYTEFPDDLKHKVNFSASGVNNNDLFDITLDTFRLSNQQLAVTYEPETVEDQQTINSFGGLDNTPAYLVRLRPTLKLNNENVVVGTQGLPIGAEFSLNISLVSPNGEEKITNTLITGNYAVIGIVSQQAVTPEAIPEEERDAWRLLYEEAVSYIDLWNQAEEELAALMQLSIARPIPTVVTLGGVIDVTYLLDTPHGFEWKGLYVDADLRAIAALNNGFRIENTEIGSKEAIKDFMRLSALQGSILENKILEDDFKIESISTAKLFGLANDSQIPILTIDKSNVESILPSLIFADDIRQDIADAVNQGFLVKIPETEMTFEDWWTGIGYIKENPETGAAGYMLSGMIAGAMGKINWEDDVYEIFGTAFSDPPNLDPNSAIFIFKISGTNRQEGNVRERLKQPLQVVVLDKTYRHVKGASVTFSIQAGGGSFEKIVPGKPRITSVMLETNAKGIASTILYLGEKTADNPSYILKNGFVWHQQVGLNIVNASLKTGMGLRSLFYAYGFPKEPNQILPTYGLNGLTDVLTLSSFVSVIILDEYGNPISNLPVDFEALSSTGGGQCAQDSRNRALLIPEIHDCLESVPVYSDCVSASQGNKVQDITNHNGASVSVILGGIPGAVYPITATYGTLPSLTFTHQALPVLNCLNPEPKLLLEVIYSSDNFGNNINAAKVNSSVPVQARLLVLRGGPQGYTLDANYTNALVKFGDSDGIKDKTSPSIYIASSAKLKEGVNTINVRATATVDGKTLSANSTLELYGVMIKNIEIQDSATGNPLTFINTDELGLTVEDFSIIYEIHPENYTASIAHIFIFEKKDNQEKLKKYFVTGRKGKFTLNLKKGSQFNFNSSYEFEVKLNAGGANEIKSERISLKFLTVDLSMELSRNGIINEEDSMLEDIPGAYIAVNNDDDDQDGRIDLEDSQVKKLPIPSNPKEKDEDDLKKLKISLLQPTDLRNKGTVSLTRNNGRVCIYSEPTKGIGNKRILWSNSVSDYQSSVDGNGIKKWDLSKQDQLSEFDNIVSFGLWIEGVENSGTLRDSEIELTYSLTENGIVKSFKDSIKVTVLKAELKSLTFKTDHGILKANTGTWDDTGAIYPEPEWRNSFGNSFPISHDKNKNIGISIEINLTPNTLEASRSRIIGDGPNNYLDFDSRYISIKGGTNQPVYITSADKLPDKIFSTAGDKPIGTGGENVEWRMVWNEVPLYMGESKDHIIYVTYGTPTGGVTEKRLNAAVKLTQRLQTQNLENNPYKIISAFNKIHLPSYNFSGDGIDPDDPYGNPIYIDRTYKDNIWKLAQRLEKVPGDGAECQAIVRFTLAVFKMIGLPGTFHAITVYADPKSSDIAIEGDLNIVDGSPDAGIGPGMYIYPPNDAGYYAGLFDGNGNYNNFEAALKYVYTGFPVKYYPGGAGGACYISANEVLNIFTRMSWAEKEPGPWGKWIEKVTIKSYTAPQNSCN